jgi:hypothetical protein
MWVRAIVAIVLRKSFKPPSSQMPTRADLSERNRYQSDLAASRDLTSARKEELTVLMILTTVERPSSYDRNVGLSTSGRCLRMSRTARLRPTP